MANTLSALNCVMYYVLETTLSKCIVTFGPGEFDEPSERNLIYGAFLNVVAEGVDVIGG